MEKFPFWACVNRFCLRLYRNCFLFFLEALTRTGKIHNWAYRGSCQLTLRQIRIWKLAICDISKRLELISDHTRTKTKLYHAGGLILKQELTSHVCETIWIHPTRKWKKDIIFADRRCMRSAMARKLRQNLPTSVADHDNLHGSTRDSFCYKLENRAVTVPLVSRSWLWDAGIAQQLQHIDTQRDKDIFHGLSRSYRAIVYAQASVILNSYGQRR